MDEFTKPKKILAYARILVEVDADYKFDGVVQIQNLDEEPIM